MYAFELDKPQKLDNWLIFPNTTLSDLNMNDCNDTINGICHDTKNVQECINICKNSTECDGGYFLETPLKNYCVPLRTTPWLKADIQPYYEFRHKDIYPIMKDFSSKVFINTENHPYPPNNANCIYYSDQFIIQNIKKGTQLSLLSSLDNTSSDIVFTKELNPTQIKIISNDNTYIHSKIIVKNGDNVMFNIPNTSFIMRKNDNSNIIHWLMRINVVNVPGNLFTIHSDDKKIGEPLDYNDKLYILYEGNIVFYNDDMEQLEIKYQNYQNAVNDNENIFFKFIPQVNTYYCHQNECKSVSLLETDSKGNIATYNGQFVSRSPGCFGLCTNKKVKDNTVIILFIILFIIFILFLFVYYKKR